MSELVCDFCNQPDPIWEYPASEVDLPGATTSIGSWCACDACMTLIDQNLRELLAQRAHDAVPYIDLAVIRETQRRFFDVRRGPAQPVKPTALHGRIFER